MLSELYDDYYAANNPPQDRREHIGASDIGQCARKVAAEKQGVAPDPTFKGEFGFAERGTLMELHHSVSFMRYVCEKHGGTLEYAGADQVRIKSNALGMAVTPDGLVRDPKGTIAPLFGVTKGAGDSPRVFAVEFKSIDPRVDPDNLPKPEHKMQAQMQIGMLRQTTFAADVTACLILYTDASNYRIKHAHWVYYSPSGFSDLLYRAELMLYKPWHLHMPEGQLAGGKECVVCPFKYQCPGAGELIAGFTANALPLGVAMAVASHADDAQEAGKARIEWANREVESRETLRDLMLAHNVNRVHLPDGRAVYLSSTPPRETWDTEAMVAALKSQGFNPESFRKQGKQGLRVSIKGGVKN